MVFISVRFRYKALTNLIYNNLIFKTMNEIAKNQLTAFAVTALENKGASINLIHNVINPNIGFIVSLEGFEKAFTINPRYKESAMLEELTNKIIDYYEEHKENLTPYTFIGVWFDKTDGIWYLDLSELILDKSKAIDLARERKQIAIYDCANRETIYTNFKK